MKIIFIFLLVPILPFCQISYSDDILGKDYEQTSIDLGKDYDGQSFCTLIKSRKNNKTHKAVLYVHGFYDYFFQTEMAEQFISKGFDFYAVDLRRYGRSWKSYQKMCDIRDIKDYFKEIDTCLKIIQTEGAQTTLLIGHSTGGLITSLYAHHRPQSKLFNALLLNSPFFDFNTSNFNKRTILPIVFHKGKKHPSKLVKRGGLSAYGESINKNHKGEWTINEQWKPIKIAPISCGWFNAIHQGHIEVSKGLIIDKPVLTMCSDHSIFDKTWNQGFQFADAVLNVKDIIYEAKKITAPQCPSSTINNNLKIIQIKNGMHDLVLSKKEVRKEVYQTIFNWTSDLIGQKLL